MKKKSTLLVLLLLLVTTAWSQDCPWWYHYSWGSDTHPVYRYPTIPSYIYTPTIPDGTGTAYMGQGKNDYRISFPNGNQVNRYNWEIGEQNVLGSKSIIYLFKSSNGMPSTVDDVMLPSVGTNGITLSTNGTQPLNNVTIQQFQNVSPIDMFIPKNPYTDRSLIFVVHVPEYYQYQYGCNGQVLPMTYPPWGPLHNDVGTFKYPWVEITVPARTEKTEFVNAGEPVCLAAGSPFGGGTTLPVPYPSNVHWGNLLIMSATSRIASIKPVGPPAGWTYLFNEGASYFYYKIADGEEEGSVNIVYNGTTTNGRLCRIWQFKNAMPILYNYTTASGLIPTIPSITSSFDGDLLVTFIYSNNGGTIGTFTGSNVTFTEPADQHGCGNASFGMNIAPIPIGGTTTTPATQTFGASVRTMSFVLKYK